MSDTLQELKDYLDQMNIYGRAAELLFWDMRTIMPKNGFEKHAQASTFFSTEVFKMSTSDKLEKIIDELMKPEEYEKLDDMWKYVVKKMKKDSQITEDDQKTAEKELQKITDAHIEQIDKVGAAKEKEIMEV